MSQPQMPDRSNMPFASDDSVRELIDATRDWATNHGTVTFQGEVYGIASEEDDGLLVSTRFMLGTAPVSYTTEVNLKSIKEAAPRAVGMIGVRSGVVIQYDEAFYTAGFDFGDGKPPGQSFNQARAQFLFRKHNGPPAVADRHFIMTSQQDGTIISMLSQLGAPEMALDDMGRNEIKTHEQQAMLEIVQGLGTLARTKRQGRRDNA